MRRVIAEIKIVPSGQPRFIHNLRAENELRNMNNRFNRRVYELRFPLSRIQ